MSSKEFGAWIDAGRPPLEPEQNKPNPVPMSAEATAGWNKWFSDSFEHHIAKRMATINKNFEIIAGIVDDNGDIMEQIQKELEDKIAKAFTVRGTFDATATYSRHDIVALNGSSFIAKRDSPGNLPGEGWQLLASVGKRGRDANEERVNRLEREIERLRTEIKEMKAMQTGTAIDLPKWPRKEVG
jgi:hypothetical protein